MTKKILTFGVVGSFIRPKRMVYGDPEGKSPEAKEGGAEAQTPLTTADKAKVNLELAKIEQNIMRLKSQGGAKREAATKAADQLKELREKLKNDQSLSREAVDKNKERINSIIDYPKDKEAIGKKMPGLKEKKDKIIKDFKDNLNGRVDQVFQKAFFALASPEARKAFEDLRPQFGEMLSKAIDEKTADITDKDTFEKKYTLDYVTQNPQDNLKVLAAKLDEQEKFLGTEASNEGVNAVAYDIIGKFIIKGESVSTIDIAGQQEKSKQFISIFNGSMKDKYTKIKDSGKNADAQLKKDDETYTKISALLDKLSGDGNKGKRAVLMAYYRDNANMLASDANGNKKVDFAYTQQTFIDAKLTDGDAIALAGELGTDVKTLTGREIKVPEKPAQPAPKESPQEAQVRKLREGLNKEKIPPELADIIASAGGEYREALLTIAKDANKPEGAKFTMLWNKFDIPFTVKRRQDGKYSIYYAGSMNERGFKTVASLMKFIANGTETQGMTLSRILTKPEYKKYEDRIGEVMGEIDIEKKNDKETGVVRFTLDWSGGGEGEGNAKVELKAMPDGMIKYTIQRDDVGVPTGNIRSGYAANFKDLNEQLARAKEWAEDKHDEAEDDSKLWMKELNEKEISNPKNLTDAQAKIGRVISFSIGKDYTEAVLDWGGSGPEDRENNPVLQMMTTEAGSIMYRVEYPGRASKKGERGVGEEAKEEVKWIKAQDVSAIIKAIAAKRAGGEKPAEAEKSKEQKPEAKDAKPEVSPAGPGEAPKVAPSATKAADVPRSAASPAETGGTTAPSENADKPPAEIEELLKDNKAISRVNEDMKKVAEAKKQGKDARPPRWDDILNVGVRWSELDAASKKDGNVKWKVKIDEKSKEVGDLYNAAVEDFETYKGHTKEYKSALASYKKAPENDKGQQLDKVSSEASKSEKQWLDKEDAEILETAKKKYNEGKDLLQATPPNYEKALSLFREAENLHPGNGPKWYIASCLDKLSDANPEKHKKSDALDAYTVFINTIREPGTIWEEKKSEAFMRILALEKELPPKAQPVAKAEAKEVPPSMAVTAKLKEKVPKEPVGKWAVNAAWDADVFVSFAKKRGSTVDAVKLEEFEGVTAHKGHAALQMADDVFGSDETVKANKGTLLKLLVRQYSIDELIDKGCIQRGVNQDGKDFFMITKTPDEFMTLLTGKPEGKDKTRFEIAVADPSYDVGKELDALKPSGTPEATAQADAAQAPEEPSPWDKLFSKNKPEAAPAGLVEIKDANEVLTKEKPIMVYLYAGEAPDAGIKSALEAYAAAHPGVKVCLPDAALNKSLTATAGAGKKPPLLAFYSEGSLSSSQVIKDSANLEGTVKDGAIIMYKRAVSSENAKKYSEALESYKDIDALFPSPSSKLGIAKCLESLGRDNEAITAYDVFLASGPENRPDIFPPAVLTDLKKQIENYREKHPDKKMA
jgi:hypothetical protein